MSVAMRYLRGRAPSLSEHHHTLPSHFRHTHTKSHVLDFQLLFIFNIIMHKLSLYFLSRTLGFMRRYRKDHLSHHISLHIHWYRKSKDNFKSSSSRHSTMYATRVILQLDLMGPPLDVAVV